jgi:hypothetical protein
MSATIKLAKIKATETVEHIDDVNKNKKVSFICVSCFKEMLAVKSIARKRDWHFRHLTESGCMGGRETALHKYAVQLLMESNGARITKNLTISYTNTRKEVFVFGKRSDVTVTHLNEDVHFEIFVTHDLGQEKVSIYKNNKIKCVRIDLSNPNLLTASSEILKELILNQHKSKTIIFWKDLSTLKKSESINWRNILLSISIGLGLIYLTNKLSKFLSSKKL